MNDASLSPQYLAEACGAVMFEKDHAARSLGIELREIRPGWARMTMTVRQDMVNGHDICHGGLIFTLADTAFAYACNGYNRITVAAGAAIDFVSPARLGDVLSAEGVERSLSGRTGVYDVTVQNQDDKLIAHFRGRSYRLQGELLTST